MGLVQFESMMRVCDENQKKKMAEEDKGMLV